MPRAAVIAAGWIIALCAVLGLGSGVVPSLKARAGLDVDTGDVVAPIKTATNATPLTAPPVTEADVRRWAREELAAQHVAAPPPRKPKVEADQPADTTDTATPPPLTIVTPSNGNIVAPTKPQATPQIPF